MFVVIFSAKKYMFMSSSSELIATKNPELFELTGSDSLFQLILKLYRIIWSPIMYTLLVVSAIKLIECVEGRKVEFIEFQENKRWNSLFAKLERMSKAIGLKEEKRREEAKEAPKQEGDEKKVNWKPSSSISWIHSISFNRRIL